MLASAIMSGELQADTRHNPLARIGTHNTSMIRRADLISFAAKRRQRPPFLFAEESTSAPSDAMEPSPGRATQTPARRRPGAKQTKLEMVKERIARDFPDGVPPGVKNSALAEKYGVHERTVRRAMGNK
jgi:hypothetical protein